VPAAYGVKVGLENYSPWGLPVDENRIILRSLVLTHYQRVVDRQTRRL